MILLRLACCAPLCLLLACTKAHHTLSPWPTTTTGTPPAHQFTVKVTSDSAYVALVKDIQQVVLQHDQSTVLPKFFSQQSQTKIIPIHIYSQKILQAPPATSKKKNPMKVKQPFFPFQLAEDILDFEFAEIDDKLHCICLTPDSLKTYKIKKNKAKLVHALGFDSSGLRPIRDAVGKLRLQDSLVYAKSSKFSKGVVLNYISQKLLDTLAYYPFFSTRWQAGHAQIKPHRNYYLIPRRPKLQFYDYASLDHNHVFITRHDKLLVLNNAFTKLYASNNTVGSCLISYKGNIITSAPSLDNSDYFQITTWQDNQKLILQYTSEPLIGKLTGLTVWEHKGTPFLVLAVRHSKRATVFSLFPLQDYL